MAISLVPAKADDCYVRLYYNFEKTNAGFVAKILNEDEASESTGWIEFWSTDARACRDPLKRITGRLYVLNERREKRKSELSDQKAYDELQEYNSLLVDGLSHRAKAWKLVNSEGEFVDAPLTFENAKYVFSDSENNLRFVCQEALSELGNYPLRASDK